MASIKEIRTRIQSVEQTLKITNAMYLISSAKLRKAKAQLTAVTPFYQSLTQTITDILRSSPDIHHAYFDRRADKKERRTGYLIIAGDKGLAGAYHHNLFRMVQEKVDTAEDAEIYAVGHLGYSTLQRKGYRVNPDFRFTAQDPTMARAEEMADTLRLQFLNGQLDEIYMIYTHMHSAAVLEPRCLRLLPLQEDAFPWVEEKQEPAQSMTYIPSADAVLSHCVPGYVTGLLFAALTDAFCSEQSARMNAMDASSKNAKEMLKDLSLRFNRARQAAITQEITEIVSGAECGKESL